MSKRNNGEPFGSVSEYHTPPPRLPLSAESPLEQTRRILRSSQLASSFFDHLCAAHCPEVFLCWSHTQLLRSIARTADTVAVARHVECLRRTFLASFDLPLALNFELNAEELRVLQDTRAFLESFDQRHQHPDNHPPPPSQKTEKGETFSSPSPPPPSSPPSPPVSPPPSSTANSPIFNHPSRPADPAAQQRGEALGVLVLTAPTFSPPPMTALFALFDRLETECLDLMKQHVPRFLQSSAFSNPESASSSRSGTPDILAVSPASPNLVAVKKQDKLLRKSVSADSPPTAARVPRSHPF